MKNVTAAIIAGATTPNKCLSLAPATNNIMNVTIIITDAILKFFSANINAAKIPETPK